MPAKRNALALPLLLLLLLAVDHHTGQNESPLTHFFRHPASRRRAETLLEYLLDRAPQDAGAAASDAAASAEATSKKAASLRERLHALVFPPLSQEQQTEADSPASPCPVRAYYAVRRVASGISSATLLGAVQLAVLAALAAVCPPLVQAAPDKARGDLS